VLNGAVDGPPTLLVEDLIEKVEAEVLTRTK